MPITDVLKSAQFINKNSVDVSVPEEGVKKAAKFMSKLMKDTNYSCKQWKDHPLHPKEENEDVLKWIFLIDLLNFSFYSNLSEADRYAVEYKGQRWTGYSALCATVNRALEEGIPFTEPKFFAAISEQQLRHIFRGVPEAKEEIPLLNERLRVLHEAGAILLEKFYGSYETLINMADKSVMTLLELVVSNFECLRDECMFKNRTVSFYKRAQILIADTWACFQGTSYGEFRDIECLTMFADYRVPQALCAVGILQYSGALKARLKDSGHEFKSGSREEVEIRGNSIYAVELLRQEIKRLEPDLQINSVLLDFGLYDYAKARSEELKDIPIHKVRSVNY